MILSRPVSRYDGGNQILRYVAVIRQQLFRILRQAIPAVPKRRVVVEIADTRVEAYAADNLLRMEAPHFGIRIKLVEVRYAQGQIRISK